ncbi:MAG: hypothetical protein MK179_13265, partial [Pirellulaceae bacterium]|nr:hypothetical protein [Pirellulaceae bacterium]
MCVGHPPTYLGHIVRGHNQPASAVHTERNLLQRQRAEAGHFPGSSGLRKLVEEVETSAVAPSDRRQGGPACRRV